MANFLSKTERQQEGQSRRKQVARAAHAHWNPKKTDRSALAILQRSGADRLPHLLALKYERMAASPFGYFRGAVPVMAHDLGHQPHTGILTQLCGDAHVRNLGAYAASDGSLTFDINDFDETIRGPFEWDVKRLATSIHLVAREAKQIESNCREAVRGFLRRYRKSLHHFAAMPVIELARYQVHRESDLAAISDVFAKAERSTPTLLRDTLTEAAPAAKAVRGARSQRKTTRPARRPGTDLLQYPPRVGAAIRSRGWGCAGFA